MAGRRVLLIEGDLRRPRLAQALGVQPVAAGVGAVLVNQGRAWRTPSSHLSSARTCGLLLVEHTAIPLADRLSLPTARKLVEEAEKLADYVVIDSPPLTEVIDALPLARRWIRF